MTTPKFSPNKKLNHVLTRIYKDLYDMEKMEMELTGYDILRNYMKKFPREPDYKLYQNGKYIPSDLYGIYRKAGYKSTDKMSPEKLEQTFMHQIGQIARYIVYNNVL